MFKTLSIYLLLSGFCPLITSRLNNKSQVDSWLQKLDKDFIGNWITYLFYTYFINDTRFYIFCQHYSIICQQKRAEKNKSIQNQTKPEVRNEDEIILYCVSPFRRLKHHPNANKQTLDSKQKHTNGSKCESGGKGKRLRTDKNGRRRRRVLRGFRLVLHTQTQNVRRSRSGGLLRCRCTGVGRCSAQCGWRGGKLGENGQFSSLSAETEVRFW